MMDFLSDLSDGIGNAGSHITDLLRNVIGIGGDEQKTVPASQAGLPQQVQRPDTPPQGGQLPDTPQRPGQTPVNNPAQAVKQVQDLHQNNPEFQRAVSQTEGLAQQVQQEHPDADPQELSQHFRDRLNDMMADKPWYASRPMSHLLFNLGVSLMSGRNLGESLASGALAAHQAYQADQRAPLVMEMAENAAKNGEINPQSEAALLEYANTGNVAALHDVKMSDLQKMKRENNEWSRRNAVTFGQSEQQSAEQYAQQREMQQASFANQSALQSASFANQRALQAASESRADARADRQMDRQLQMYGIKQAMEQQQQQQKAALAEQKAAKTKEESARSALTTVNSAFNNPVVKQTLQGNYGLWNTITDYSPARQAVGEQFYDMLRAQEMLVNGGHDISDAREQELKERADSLMDRGNQAANADRLRALKIQTLSSWADHAPMPDDIKREVKKAVSRDPDSVTESGGRLIYTDEKGNRKVW